MINILNYIFLLTLYVQKQNPRANTYTNKHIHIDTYDVRTNNDSFVRWTCIALRELYISAPFIFLSFSLQDLQHKRLFI